MGGGRAGTSRLRLPGTIGSLNSPRCKGAAVRLQHVHGTLVAGRHGLSVPHKNLFDRLEGQPHHASPLHIGRLVDAGAAATAGGARRAFDKVAEFIGFDDIDLECGVFPAFHVKAKPRWAFDALKPHGFCSPRRLTSRWARPVQRPVTARFRLPTSRRLLLAARSSTACRHPSSTTERSA